MAESVHNGKHVESIVEEGESMDVTLQGEAENIERVSHEKVNDIELFVAATNYSETNGVGVGPHLLTTSSRKRTRAVEEERREIEKRGCEEGMSWWTCLMLDISQDNAEPQVIKRVYDQREN